MRIALFGLGLLVATGCRVERTWYSNVEMDRPGTRDDIWIATVSDQIREGHHAENCGGPEIIAIAEGLSVTEVEWDGWQGECWLLVDATLDADAADTTQLTVAFTFDLCSGSVGRDAVCAEADRNTRQERTVTINAR